MSLTAAQEAGLIEAVRDAARAAILPHFRSLSRDQIDTKSGPDDFVTVADRMAEAQIAAEARRVLPGAAVVGEEAVASDSALLGRIGAGQCVIIDPVDGTWNFAHGISTFGVILAVVEDGETVFGLLYDPVCDDWILARKGGGAWFCQPGLAPVSLRVGSEPVEIDAAFGFVALYLFPQEKRLPLIQSLVRFRRTGSLRCSCHEYRTLAQGFADFSLNAMLNPWDHAAGALAVQEAGGVARLLDGRDYAPTLKEGRLLLARTEDAWETLATVFRPLGL